MDLDAFLAAAEELLAVPSTADRPEELRRAVEFVVDYVGAGPGPGPGPGPAPGPAPGPGCTVERFESNGKPSALIYRAADGTTRPPFRVVLNGHLDVVPGAPEQFRPRRDGNRLWARGAQDMKISALVQAHVFRELAPRLPYPLALQLVADEEVGGRDGTLHQIERGVTGEFVVLGEHSRLDIVADSKGLLHATLEADGRSSHGAYPWLGENALLKLVESVTRLMARYPAPTEEVWRTTVNLARMETPNRAFNQVPDRARAWLDIRFPADDADLDGRTVEEVSAYLGTFCAPGVTVAVDHLDPPHRADHDLPDMRALRAAAQAQGYPANFLYKHGSGDGGFYSARGMAAVSFGVGGDGQHGPEEYAEIDTIAPYHRALETFLTTLSAA